MKISKTFVSLFFLTFGIGWFVAAALKFEDANSAFISVPNTFTEIAENRKMFKTESKVKPKVFNVERFWDELENQHNKHLLELGEVSNGEDFKIKSGEIWLGLYGKNKNTKLASAKIRVRREKSNEREWTVFLNDKNDKPLFLVKNLPKVKPGKVKTLLGWSWKEIHEREADYPSLKKDFVREFKLGDKLFTLRVEEGVNEKDERILVLLLDDGVKRQIVYYIYYTGEGEPVGNLYWAGDLDSDGKLDLFMDFWNYEKGGYTSGLFLSSEAKKGNLVKLFEYFATGGC